MKCRVIIERGAEDFYAYVPDLPGCTSAGCTYEETMANIRETIEEHLEVMREHGEAIPEPVSVAADVEVEMAAWAPGSDVTPQGIR